LTFLQHRSIQPENSEKWDQCRALLFDKDGTIINFRLMWLGWCREIINALEITYSATLVEKNLSAWGVDLALGHIAPDGYLAIGTTKELQHSLAGRLSAEGFTTDKTEADVYAAMQHAYHTVEEKKMIRAIPGVDTTIRELQNRGYLLAIVTTDDTQKAVDNLRTMGLESSFKLVLGCDRVANCKPAPDLTLEACRLLGVKPAEVAVIGDTLADVRMGKAARVACCIGVASGVTFPESLVEEADLVLESVAQMI
jgi:phosphoglycolate phosphatase